MRYVWLWPLWGGPLVASTAHENVRLEVCSTHASHGWDSSVASECCLRSVWRCQRYSASRATDDVAGGGCQNDGDRKARRDDGGPAEHSWKPSTAGNRKARRDDDTSMDETCKPLVNHIPSPQIPNSQIQLLHKMPSAACCGTSF